MCVQVHHRNAPAFAGVAGFAAAFFAAVLLGMAAFFAGAGFLAAAAFFAIVFAGLAAGACFTERFRAAVVFIALCFAATFAMFRLS